MKKLITVTSIANHLPVNDIDTDRIIPARFLKATTRSGFGENLFRDWRFLPSGEVSPKFIWSLDASRSILVTGHNFGCGSSREHAAWALNDFGIECIISTGFADIFRINALNNGVLVVEVSPEFLTHLLDNQHEVISVNLESQSVRCCGEEFQFEIDAHKKECLLNGQDDVDYLLGLEAQVQSFENTDN